MNSPTEPALDDLKQAIYQFMQIIDPILAKQETPLDVRAFHAAARFVEDFVLDVNFSIRFSINSSMSRAAERGH